MNASFSAVPLKPLGIAACDTEQHAYQREQSGLRGFAQKVTGVVYEAQLHTKSELGAVATSQRVNS
jgi:hypothetical protein